MIWIIASWTVFAAGLVVFVFGIFWDRPGRRGRAKLRCPKCWYDLQDSGNLPITCPECGKISKTERAMRRTRRHKRIAILGLMFMTIAPVIGFTPAYQKGNLLKRVPSWVLVEVLPIFPKWKGLSPISSSWNHPRMELTRRISGNRNPMRHEEFVDVVLRSAKGNIFATPGSPKWVRTTGDWIGSQQFQYKDWKTGQMHYPDGTPADHALTEAFEQLASVLPAWDAKTRKLWPEGEIVTVWSGYEHPSWPTGKLYESASLVIRGHQEEPEHIEIKNFLNSFQLRARGKTGDHLVCEITLNYHRVPKGWDWGSESELPSIHTQQFVINWNIVEEMKDAIDLVDSEPIQQAMIVYTAMSVSESLDGFNFHNDWLQPKFDRIGFGVIIQVYDGDEFLGQSQQWWMGQDGEWIGRIQGMTGTSYEQVLAYPAHAADAIGRGALRFRIIGDPALAMGLIEPEIVWEGQIDITYSDALKVIDAYIGGED